MSLFILLRKGTTKCLREVAARVCNMKMNKIFKQKHFKQKNSKNWMIILRYKSLKLMTFIPISMFFRNLTKISAKGSNVYMLRRLSINKVSLKRIYSMSEPLKFQKNHILAAKMDLTFEHPVS